MKSLITQSNECFVSSFLILPKGNIRYSFLWIFDLHYHQLQYSSVTDPRSNFANNISDHQFYPTSNFCYPPTI